jgi:hypothetical protein
MYGGAGAHVCVLPQIYGHVHTQTQKLVSIEASGGGGEQSSYSHVHSRLITSVRPKSTVALYAYYNVKNAPTAEHKF